MRRIGLKTWGLAAALALIAAPAARADEIYSYGCSAITSHGCTSGFMSLEINTTQGTGTYSLSSGPSGPYTLYDSFTFNPANVSINTAGIAPTITISNIDVLPSSFTATYPGGAANVSQYNSTTTNNSLTVATGGTTINGANIAGDVTLTGDFATFAANNHTTTFSYLNDYTPPLDGSSSGGSSSGGTPVPEPGAFALFALASASLWWRRRRLLQQA